MDRRAWQAAVHGSQTLLKRLSPHACIHSISTQKLYQFLDSGLKNLAASTSCCLEHVLLEPSYHVMKKSEWPQSNTPVGEELTANTRLSVLWMNHRGSSFSVRRAALADTAWSKDKPFSPSPAQVEDLWAKYVTNVLSHQDFFIRMRRLAILKQFRFAVMATCTVTGTLRTDTSSFLHRQGRLLREMTGQPSPEWGRVSQVRGKERCVLDGRDSSVAGSGGMEQPAEYGELWALSSYCSIKLGIGSYWWCSQRGGPRLKRGRPTVKA